MNFDQARVFAMLHNGYSIWVRERNPELPPTVSDFIPLNFNLFRTLKDAGLVVRSALRHETRPAVTMFVASKKGRSEYAEFLGSNVDFLDGIRHAADAASPCGR